MKRKKDFRKNFSVCFCGARADIKNPKVKFVLPKKTKRKSNFKYPHLLLLEVRIKNTDPKSLFAFSVTKDGYVIEKDNVFTAKDPKRPNFVLYHGYSLALKFAWSKERVVLENTRDRLYVFWFLPHSNEYEIYEAEIKITGECEGLLVWQRVANGYCCQENWELTAEEKYLQKWPPLSTLFACQAFQEKFKPYIFTKQIPCSGSKNKSKQVVSF